MLKYSLFWDLAVFISIPVWSPDVMATIRAFRGKKYNQFYEGELGLFKVPTLLKQIYWNIFSQSI